jgi:hypothetical protein
MYTRMYICVYTCICSVVDLKDRGSSSIIHIYRLRVGRIACSDVHIISTTWSR